MRYKVTREAIVDAALSCRGLPFVHQGRSETGIDCVGLLYLILKKVDYPQIHDVEGYKRSPSATVIRETFEKNFNEIPVEDAKRGDILLLKIGAKPKHAGVIVSDVAGPDTEPEMVHATQGTIVVEPIRHWRPRIVSAFRLRGLWHT